MSWRDRAACYGTHPDVFHPQGCDLHYMMQARARGLAMSPVLREGIRAAKAICVGCPVASECLDYAIEIGETCGVWGGMDPLQRRVVERSRQQSAGR